jgi:hypothetical protein
VLHPFIVILVLMVLLQFSGQGAITFYTVQIFQVNSAVNSTVILFALFDSANCLPISKKGYYCNGTKTVSYFFILTQLTARFDFLTTWGIIVCKDILWPIGDFLQKIICLRNNWVILLCFNCSNQCCGCEFGLVWIRISFGPDQSFDSWQCDFQFRSYIGIRVHCKSVPAQSQIWHTIWQSCLKWRTISHMWSIFCFTCVKYASPFFCHMVCQICLKWSQQRIIVKHIWHNMCQMWLCAGARFTVLWLNPPYREPDFTSMYALLWGP